MSQVLSFQSDWATSAMFCSQSKSTLKKNCERWLEILLKNHQSIWEANQKKRKEQAFCMWCMCAHLSVFARKKWARDPKFHRACKPVDDVKLVKSSPPSNIRRQRNCWPRALCWKWPCVLRRASYKEPGKSLTEKKKENICVFLEMADKRERQRLDIPNWQAPTAKF